MSRRTVIKNLERTMRKRVSTTRREVRAALERIATENRTMSTPKDAAEATPRATQILWCIDLVTGRAIQAIGDQMLESAKQHLLREGHPFVIALQLQSAPVFDAPAPEMKQ